MLLAKILRKVSVLWRNYPLHCKSRWLNLIAPFFVWAPISVGIYKGLSRKKRS